jgi:hypothetical protein
LFAVAIFWIFIACFSKSFKKIWSFFLSKTNYQPINFLRPNKTWRFPNWLLNLILYGCIRDCASVSYVTINETGPSLLSKQILDKKQKWINWIFLNRSNINTSFQIYIYFSFLSRLVVVKMYFTMYFIIKKKLCLP